MEALCVAKLSPCCSSQTGLAISRHVKGARNVSTQRGACMPRSALACRSSSYATGSSDLGSLKVETRQSASKAVVLKGPRCETADGGPNTKVDVWIGRVAMLSFVAAIGIEINSGKGVLANLGVSTPAPTLALALTAIVGGIVAFGVFGSAASEE